MSYQHAICRLVVNDRLFGTGFLFTDDHRHVLTAGHVAAKLAERIDLHAGVGDDSAGAHAYFAHARLDSKIEKLVHCNKAEDWAVLRLDRPIGIQPLMFGSPKDGAACRAWGYPNVLHVGLKTPENAVLMGMLADVVALDESDESKKFKLIGQNSKDDLQGISGAPVLVGDAWVGIVLSAHYDDHGKPILNQFIACRSECIVHACEALDLPVRGGRYGVSSLPKNYKWPEKPFPGPVPLSDEHARMLHGRFRALRRLLDYIAQPAERLLLLTGRVGVGKSSLLQAGLIPHIRAKDAKSDIRFAIRDARIGLPQTLRNLARGATANTILVLDQVEECLIPGIAVSEHNEAKNTPRSNEAEQFARMLADILDPDLPTAPRCVILGCRSDYAGDLKLHLREAHLRWDTRTLKPLKREDIVEVLSLANDVETKKHFRIKVAFGEDSLEHFADELLRDEDGTVAPLLQIRMQRMYELATEEADVPVEEADENIYVFDNELYTRVARDLVSIDSYLDGQLSNWPEELRWAVESGLVLDILEFHTSLQATAQPQPWTALEARYCTTPDSKLAPPCDGMRLQRLVGFLQTKGLLVDSDQSRKGKGRKRIRQTSIGHDEIARVAKQAFQRSARSGQRSRRLLEFRLGGVSPAERQNVVLNDIDLQIVEAGLGGMRALDADEVACVTRSRETRARRREEEARRLEEERKEKERVAKAEADAQEERIRRAEEQKQASRKAFILVSLLLGVAVIAMVVIFRLNESRERDARAAALVEIRLNESRERDAKAAALAEKGALALADRNFVEAEITYAKSLLLREDPVVRRALLRARGGSIRLGRREADDAQGLSSISADGLLFATMMGPGQIELGDAATGARRWTISVSGGEVECLAFGPASKHGRLFASAVNRSVAVFRLEEDGKVTALGTLDPRPKRISSMVFHPAGRSLAVASDDGSLKLFVISGHTLKEQWSQPAADTIAVHGLAFKRDGSILASGGGDYSIHLWWAENGKHITTLEGHHDSVFAVAFNDEGTKLASGGYDRGIRIWNLEPLSKLKSTTQFRGKLETIQILQGHEGLVLDLRFSKNGSMLASASKDESLRLWDVEHARLVTTFKPRLGILRSIAFTGFGQAIACGGEHGWTRWESGARKEAYKLWVDGEPITAVAIDPTSRFLVAGDSKGRLWRWELEKDLSHTPVGVMEGGVNNLSFSPDGRWLAAVGQGVRVNDGGEKASRLALWEHGREEWKNIETNIMMSGDSWGVTFDPGSRWLAMGSAGTEPQIALLKSGSWSLEKEISPTHDIYALAVVNGLLVSGNSNGELYAYSLPDLIEGSHAQNVTHGERNVWSVVPTAKNWVVSGNSDGIVRIWDPRRNQTIAETAQEEASINPTLNSVAYNEKRRTVAASGDGHQVVEYELVEPGKEAAIGQLVPKQRYFGQEGTVWMVTYSPNGRWLAYGGLDGFARVVDLDAADRVMAEDPAKLLAESEVETGLTVGDDLKVRMPRRQ